MCSKMVIVGHWTLGLSKCALLIWTPIKIWLNSPNYKITTHAQQLTNLRSLISFLQCLQGVLKYAMMFTINNWEDKMPNKFLELLVPNIQGHRKGRTKTTWLLRNLKMLFRCCILAHINHKLGTFYYLHQHSQKLHAKIHLSTLQLTG